MNLGSAGVYLKFLRICCFLVIFIYSTCHLLCSSSRHQNTFSFCRVSSVTPGSVAIKIKTTCAYMYCLTYVGRSGFCLSIGYLLSWPYSSSRGRSILTWADLVWGCLSNLDRTHSCCVMSSRGEVVSHVCLWYWSFPSGLIRCCLAKAGIDGLGLG